MIDNESNKLKKLKLNISDSDKVLIKSKLMGNLNIGRLLMLMFLSLILCSFGPLSLFAAVPVTMAFLIFGYKKSIIFTILVLTVLSVLITGGQLTNDWIFIAGSFLFANLIALIISKMILNNIHPSRGLLMYGGTVVTVVFLILGYFTLSLEVSLSEKVGEYVAKSFDALKNHENYKVIISAGGEESRNLKDLIDHPEKVATEILHWSVSTIFVSFFFMIWLNIFLVLKNSLLWKELHGYEYTIKDLTRFKLPTEAVGILILSLLMILFGDYLFKDLGQVIGVNILYCLGVFYFFSGFGVYLEFLDSVNIKGFFRNVLTVITIFLAFKMIALIGVLDTWIDFRRFFKKNDNNEGDIV